MSTDQILNYLIIAISVILSISILLQARGSGLGSMFGGGSGGGEMYRSRRGLEKFLYYLTVISAIILVALCVASLVI
ncbi:preprotein translocase subunit SecG [bacterium]|nr:MAG: preprotein translocase subunit SecG [bacterium]